MRRRGPVACCATLADRRLAGEPLAWITGRAAFGDLDVRRRTPGSTSPAGRAWSWPGAPPPDCPTTASAVDLCTGSGAVAVALRRGPAGGPHRGDRQRRARRRLRPGQRGRGLPGRPLRRRAGVVPGRRPTSSSRWCPTSRPPTLHLLPRDTLELRGRRPLRRRPGRHRRAAAGRHRRARLPAPGRGAAAGAGRRPGRRCSAPRSSDLGLRRRPDLVRRGRRPAAAWRRRSADSDRRVSAGRRPAATDDRSTTCQRGSWARYSASGVCGSPHDVGDVVGGQDGVRVRGQVRDRHELGEHRALEEVRPPVDEGGPVAGHRVVAPGVLREDPARMRAEVVEGLRRAATTPPTRPGRRGWPRRRWRATTRPAPAQRRAVVPQGAPRREGRGQRRRRRS